MVNIKKLSEEEIKMITELVNKNLTVSSITKKLNEKFNNTYANKTIKRKISEYLHKIWDKENKVYIADNNVNSDINIENKDQIFTNNNETQKTQNPTDKNIIESINNTEEHETIKLSRITDPSTNDKISNKYNSKDEPSLQFNNKESFKNEKENMESQITGNKIDVDIVNNSSSNRITESNSTTEINQDGDIPSDKFTLKSINDTDLIINFLLTLNQNIAEMNTSIKKLSNRIDKIDIFLEKMKKENNDFSSEIESLKDDFIRIFGGKPNNVSINVNKTLLDKIMEFNKKRNLNEGNKSAAVNTALLIALYKSNF